MATKITDRKGKKECIIFDLCADNGNTDQRTLSKIITSLYVKADRMEDAPSILNNDKVTLADHTAYRHIRENLVFVSKKNTLGISILRVVYSDSETRVEFEVETLTLSSYANISS